MKRTYLSILLVLLLTVPTFLRMARPGLYSMQDFPYFRVVEYTKCLQDAQIPCRWAPDAGLGYGEPVFNFYSHIPFLIPAVLTQAQFSTVIALKLTFAFSLFGSAIGMFLLSRHVWKSPWAGFISSILYIYAPYRAVNVWVRGALAESFAFLILPLILLCFEKYLESSKKSWLTAFSLSLAALILTHNLSVLLFSLTIAGWILLRLIQTKKLKLLINLSAAAIVSILLSAFYLVPSLLENSLVNLNTTTTGYFDFRAHFVTIPQLLISRFWGYGGSTWGSEDGLSFSVGQVQLLVGLFTFLLAAYLTLKTKKLNSRILPIIFLTSSSLFYLFLTHNKSAPLWEFTSSISKYIQFPWRFLGIIVFSLSLCAGYIGVFSKKSAKVFAVVIVILAIVLNVNFFREDLWLEVDDQSMQSEDTWVNQTRASIGDYWPIYGPIPTEYVKDTDDIKTMSKNSKSARFTLNLSTDKRVEFPIAYFPGWKGIVDGNEITLEPSEKGLISAQIPARSIDATLTFTNSPTRTLGNVVSLITALLATIWYLKQRKQH